ncbi:Hypothetical_protein [Hexamita inflata]|uniref:Hypothetical_protein n=1 Tax=Hexamita inflata TaxID=28002 RepID=A0AA86UVL5_9EUKA|nr:Hypothetical protein HINF_LOCUS61230 [Hexamita inflata]
MSEDNICSEDSSTERSQSSDSVLFNFDFDELPDSRKRIKEVRGNINNIIKRQQYSDVKFEFEYIGEKLYVNPSCIDQKEYPTLSLHLDGVHNVSNIKCIFDMSGFARVTKPIELISLVGCTIYLEQFTVHSKNVSLENCVIYGESQLFTCESLQLSVSGFHNLDWIDDSKCKALHLVVNQSEFYDQIKQLSKYKSLKRILITESTVDLSLLNFELSLLVFRRCELQNSVTAQMKVDELHIYDSQLRSSQLKSAKVNKLYYLPIFPLSNIDQLQFLFVFLATLNFSLYNQIIYLIDLNIFSSCAFLESVMLGLQSV